VPLLIGATSFEGSLATNLGTKPEQILKVLGRRVEELRADYAEIGLELDDVELAYQAYGDATFVSPARYLARLMARKSVPVWLYHFDVVPEAWRKNSRGAPHGGEIPYVFKTASRLSRMSAAIGPSDAKIAELMHKAWVAFAENGDPNHSSLSVWKPVTSDSTPTLVVTSNGAKIDNQFEQPVLDFFDDRFRKLRRLFPTR
jgi:para-nitrobenzyl esterase